MLYPYWDILHSVSLFSAYTQGLHCYSSLKQSQDVLLCSVQLYLTFIPFLSILQFYLNAIQTFLFLLRISQLSVVKRHWDKLMSYAKILNENI